MNNIYYLLGSPCSGKTTISKLLCDKHDMFYFSGDIHRFDFYKNSNKEKHPYMTKNAIDFFEWNIDEMIEWERGVILEQTPMIIDKLKELSVEHDKVLFEGMLNISKLNFNTDKNHGCYLTVDRELSEKTFYNRESHKELLANIMNNKNITDEEKKRRVHIRKKAAIEAFDIDIVMDNITQFNRTNMSVEELFHAVEEHFDLI